MKENVAYIIDKNEISLIYISAFTTGMGIYAFITQDYPQSLILIPGMILMLLLTWKKITFKNKIW